MPLLNGLGHLSSVVTAWGQTCCGCLKPVIVKAWPRAAAVPASCYKRAFVLALQKLQAESDCFRSTVIGIRIRSSPAKSKQSLVLGWRHSPWILHCRKRCARGCLFSRNHMYLCIFSHLVSTLNRPILGHPGICTCATLPGLCQGLSMHFWKSNTNNHSHFSILGPFNSFCVLSQLEVMCVCMPTSVGSLLRNLS